MPHRLLLTIMAVALLAGACGDDTSDASTAAAPAATAAGTTTTAAAASATTTTTVAATTTTTKPIDVAAVASRFSLAPGDLGADYAKATDPAPATSPTSQQLFVTIRADATCAAVKEAFPPPSYVTDLKYEAYYSRPAGAAYKIQLFNSTSDSAKQLVPLYTTQRPLIAACEQKHLRALLPDYTVTAEARPEPAGFPGPVAFSKGTLDSATLRVSNDSFQTFVVLSPFHIVLTQSGPRGTLDEAEFLRVAKLAATRLADALKA